MEAIAARWDAKALTWDQSLEDPECHLNEDNAYDSFLDLLASVILERQQFCRTQGVIDAGCATGLVLARIVRHFAWGTGVDISPNMIRIAQAKSMPRATFIVGDCFNLEAIGPKAGAVVSRGVLLSHYGHRQGKELLQSVRRALVDGGFLIFDFLTETGRGLYQHSPPNKTYFQAEQVLALAASAGLRNASILGEASRRVQLLLAE